MRCSSEVDQLEERSPDYGAVLDELLAALQHIAVLQLVQGRLDDEEIAALAPLAERVRRPKTCSFIIRSRWAAGAICRFAGTRAWVSR